MLLKRTTVKMTFLTLKQKFDIYDASKRTSVFPNVL